jgi:hypothetical protein
MPTPTRKQTRKPGANRGEVAKKPRKLDANFAQSRDIRENRGERRPKTALPPTTVLHSRTER